MNEELSEEFVALASSSRGTTNDAFEALLPPVVETMSKASTPEMAMGVVQALYRLATVIAQSTIGTPLDVLMRTPTDAAALGEAHWKAAAYLTELVVAEMKRRGMKLPPYLCNQADATASTGGEAAAPIASMSSPSELATMVTVVESDNENSNANLADAVSLINCGRGGVS